MARTLLLSSKLCEVEYSHQIMAPKAIKAVKMSDPPLLDVDVAAALELNLGGTRWVPHTNTPIHSDIINIQMCIHACMCTHMFCAHTYEDNRA